LGVDRLTDGWSYMDNNSLPQPANPQASSPAGRRSTRIDYVTPIIIFGRDVAGQPFRELTQTAVVNLHGCKLRTAYRVLVGMAIMMECPKSGMSGKAVCVRVWDAAAGLTGREIAVQLIKPQNLWGVPTPPPDWEVVAKAMVQGRMAQSDPPTAAGRVVAVAPEAWAPPALASPRAAATPSRIIPNPIPPPAPSVEQRSAELEQRSTQLVDSVLDILRGQAEEITRASLEVFRQQVEALIYDVEQRLRRELRDSYEESASSLVSLRKDIMEQMTARGAQLVRSADEILRSRFRELLTAQDRAAPAKPAEPVTPK
jgi:hypothetical protein